MIDNSIYFDVSFTYWEDIPKGRQQMLKFEITLESKDKSQILEFEDLRDFWKWTNKHYIKEIKTLDGDK